MLGLLGLFNPPNIIPLVDEAQVPVYPLVAVKLPKSTALPNAWIVTYSIVSL